MILEAFSGHLHERSGKGHSSEEILHQWLFEILSAPQNRREPVTCVIHTEIGMQLTDGKMQFAGLSATGDRLLSSLYGYCKSFDHWQFTRWLHHLRASDFPPFISEG